MKISSLGFVAFAMLATNFSVSNLHAAANFPPDLLVTIPQGGAQVEAGSIFSYLIDITNIGGDLPANNVVLTVTPPDTGELVATAQDGDDCVLTNGILDCPIGTLNNLDVATVEIQWRAPNFATTLTLTAEATESGSDLAEDIVDNNTATIDTPVIFNNADDNSGCSLNPGATPNLSFGWIILSSLGLMVFRGRRPKF